MSAKRKLSWLRISAGVVIAVVTFLIVLYVWLRIGSLSQALGAYRKATEFMEALRAKDEQAVCRLFRERERPRCVGLVANWFQVGELPRVDSYSLRSIEALASDGAYFDYSVRFAVSPFWSDNGLNLILVREHQRLVVSNFTPPATGF